MTRLLCRGHSTFVAISRSISDPKAGHSLSGKQMQAEENFDCPFLLRSRVWIRLSRVLVPKANSLFITWRTTEHFYMREMWVR